MLRLCLAVLPFMALGACGAPATQSGAESGSTTTAPAPVNIPMDPGRISCAQVNTNSSYATAGAPWVNGQLRASNLRTGSAFTGASDGDTAIVLARYCDANASATLRDAVAQLAAG